LWKLLAEQDDCIKQPFYALEGGEIEKSVFLARKTREKQPEKNLYPTLRGDPTQRVSPA
jgi:hypothetical protein